MTEHLIVTVILMGAVTYFPRMLPFAFLQHLRLPPFVRRVFQFVPYAAISALVVPSAFASTASPASAAVGVLAALVLALVEANLLVIILASIGAVYLSETVLF